MNGNTMTTMVEDYFLAVDKKNSENVSNFFGENSTFEIATFGTVFRGKGEIMSMFDRLFKRYDSISHKNFHHIFCEKSYKIASQFDVENLCFNGTMQRKKNANFFLIQHNIFTSVHVYMSGENSLK